VRRSSPRVDSSGGGKGRGLTFPVRVPETPRVRRARARLVTGTVVAAALATLAGIPAGGSGASPACPPAARVFKGVYDPTRLALLNRCKAATGRVVAVGSEEVDGDIHIVLSGGTTGRLVSPGNKRPGGLVVEFMPRDGGHLPKPRVGDRLTLLGAWVNDTNHAWRELHPVWVVRVNGGRARVSGPQFGGSPASATPAMAARLCRDEKGRACRGYGG
jgi:hypothetical protein